MGQPRSVRRPDEARARDHGRERGCRDCRICWQTVIDQRGLLDHFPAMVWHARATDGSDVWFNRTWLEFRGRTLDEETGSGWLDHGVHPDDRDRLPEVYQAAFAAKEPFVLEYRLRRADGTWRWISASGRPVHLADDTFGGFVGVCHDVTERRAVVERLEAAQDATTLLLQTLFHDIAGPLASTSGAADLLRQVPPDEREPLLDLVDAQLRRMQRVLDDVRDYDLASRGGLVPRPTLVDLEHLVHEVVDNVNDGETRRDLRVEVVAPTTVWLGAAMTERILENLVANAVAHTPRDARIEVDARVRGDVVELTVCDDGPGIDPVLLPEIFNPYRQGTAGTGRFGLGLSLVQRYAEAHGGSVRARNLERSGACFEVTLPLLTPET